MDIPAIQSALNKRGFQLADAHAHPCKACGERGVARYGLAGGRLGGRLIELCLACGKARSFVSKSGMEERVEDTAFDLTSFLR